MALPTAGLNYLLQCGDNALILGQRLGEWTGHGPALEPDIALTNIALDLVGEARNWLTLAGELEDKGRSEDDLAFLRHATDYRNLLLVEQPNEDFGHTLMRQFLFDSFHYFQLESLTQSSHEGIRAIAHKSLKESTYHLRYSSEWVIRLGDGTEESRERMQIALNELWRFADEALLPTPADEWGVEQGWAVSPADLGERVNERRQTIFREATLTIPPVTVARSGGKTGAHTESLGFILAEMQFLQRSYPGATW